MANVESDHYKGVKFKNGQLPLEPLSRLIQDISAQI